MPKYMIVGLSNPPHDPNGLDSVVLNVIKSKDPRRAKQYIVDRYIPADIISDDLLDESDDVMNPPYPDMLVYTLAIPLPAPAVFSDSIAEGQPIQRIGIIRFPNDEQAGLVDLDPAVGGRRRRRETRRRKH